MVSSIVIGFMFRKNVNGMDLNLSFIDSKSSSFYAMNLFIKFDITNSQNNFGTYIIHRGLFYNEYI